MDIDRARFEGRVAVVTGGGSGIGAACARRLRAEGACVATLDIGGEVDHRVDVQNDDDVATAVSRIVGRHGRIDVLVNSAGVTANGRVDRLDPADWERVIGINLTGTYTVCRHVLRHMVDHGTGSVVNIASVVALEGMEGAAAYAASKAGVVMLTRCMAIDYGAIGVRVNCVCPGWIESPMFDAVMSGPRMDVHRARLRERHKLSRFGTTDEVAAAILFLASDEASFVTGHALVVDGGYTSGLRLSAGSR